MPRAWLADELVAALGSVSGSVEREHLTALIRRSARVWLDGSVARGIAETVCAAPGSIERNLHHVFLPGTRPLWIECSHQDRLLANTREPVKDSAPRQGEVPVDVGCLLAVNPDDAHHVAIFVAWRNKSGAIYHSYAMLHWNMADFARAAKRSRISDGSTPEERLMGLAAITVPPGLAAEMEVWQSLPSHDPAIMEQAVRQTQRDSFGEHLFLIATLLMLGSDAVEMETIVAADDEADIAPIWTAHMRPQGHRWPRRRRSGFHRTLIGGTLTWQPPS